MGINNEPGKLSILRLSLSPFHADVCAETLAQSANVCACVVGKKQLPGEQENID
jgi:hypothetical protein